MHRGSQERREYAQRPNQVRDSYTGAVEYESIVPNPKLKLLDQMREVMRLRHYSIRTEGCDCDWVRRFVKFHGLRSREEMFPGEPKIEAFLSELAEKGNVGVSTQNQAFNALLFVYREVLGVQLGQIQSVRARRPARVPTVLSAEEARQIIVAMIAIDRFLVVASGDGVIPPAWSFDTQWPCHGRNDRVPPTNVK